MHRKIYIYKVICPECGTVHYGFVGENEDGSFCCDRMVEMKKGKKTTTEECGYCSEKIRHLPDCSYEMIKTIKIEDFGFANETSTLSIK